MREKLRKKNRGLLLVLLLLIVTVGFAALSTNLNINGNSKIFNSTWDIHFNNIRVTPGSVAIGTGDYAAKVDENDNTNVNFTITLDKPGDYYEFLVDVVNAGSIDGTIESITSTLKINNDEPFVITKNPSNLPKYILYDVTYSDDTEIQANHELKSGDTETYKVRVEYNKDISSLDLPSSDKTLSFGIRPLIKQSIDSYSSPSSENYMYAFLNPYEGGLYVSIGDSLSSIGGQFQKKNFTTYCYTANSNLENGNIIIESEISCYYSHDMGSSEFESLNDCQNYLTNSEYSDYSCIKRPSEPIGILSTDWSIAGAKTMLRLVVNNEEKVERVDVCYIHNDNLHCLKGTTGYDDSNIEQLFSDNISVLNSTFNNCELKYNNTYNLCSNTIYRHACTDLDGTEFAEIDTDLSVDYYGDSGLYCYVYRDGGGSCAFPS